MATEADSDAVDRRRDGDVGPAAEGAVAGEPLVDWILPRIALPLVREADAGGRRVVGGDAAGRGVEPVVLADEVDAAFTNGASPDNTVYPYVDFDVALTGPGGNAVLAGRPAAATRSASASWGSTAAKVARA